MYGVATKESDIDIVIYDRTFDILQDLLKSMNIETYKASENPNYYSFYFKLRDDMPRINIIPTFTEEEFKEWEYATKKMLEIDPIENKEERIEMFHKFRGEYQNKNGEIFNMF